MVKVTKEEEFHMQELRDAGLTYAEISEEVGFSASTVQYHLHEHYRQKTRARSRGWYNSNIKGNRKKLKEHYENRKEYHKKYFKRKYREDEEFRKKHIARVKASQNE